MENTVEMKQVPSAVNSKDNAVNGKAMPTNAFMEKLKDEVESLPIKEKGSLIKSHKKEIMDNLPEPLHQDDTTPSEDEAEAAPEEDDKAAQEEDDPAPRARNPRGSSHMRGLGMRGDLTRSRSTENMKFEAEMIELRNNAEDHNNFKRTEEARKIWMEMASLYHSRGLNLLAGTYFKKSGDLKNAASAFEACGEHRKAELCLARLNDKQ
jgi:hypothetical protein